MGGLTSIRRIERAATCEHMRHPSAIARPQAGRGPGIALENYGSANLARQGTPETRHHDSSITQQAIPKISIAPRCLALLGVLFGGDSRSPPCLAWNDEGQSIGWGRGSTNLLLADHANSSEISYPVPLLPRSVPCSQHNHTTTASADLAWWANRWGWESSCACPRVIMQQRPRRILYWRP
jgi:hypothetical protein